MTARADAGRGLRTPALGPLLGRGGTALSAISIRSRALGSDLQIPFDPGPDGEILPTDFPQTSQIGTLPLTHR